MVRTCIVDGCPSLSSQPSHSFPRDETQRIRWINAIQHFKGNITPEDMNKYVVCHLHFNENDYWPDNYRYRKLMRKAIPSVNLPQKGNVLYQSKQQADIITGPSPSCVSESTDLLEESVAGPSSGIINVQSSQSTLENTSTAQRKPLKIIERHTTKVIRSPTAKDIYNTTSKRRWKQRVSSVSSVNLKSFRKREQQATRYANMKAIKKLLNTLSPLQREFFEMQLRVAQYKPQGRRFSLDEKMLCLSIYRQSSKAYRFLQGYFHLPTPRTLRLFLNKMKLKPGINHFLMDYLKDEVRKMNSTDKVCYLMWDQMALETHIEYDLSNDRIVGFEDFGYMRRGQFADHALVFMIQGIQREWILPVSYYFCNSRMKTLNLVKCIKENTEALLRTGLNVVAYVCDEAPSNIAAINSLILSTRHINLQLRTSYKNTIRMYQNNVIPIYDPPHLIKSIRNNLLSKDLEIECQGLVRQFASWASIALAYKMDSTDSLYRLMPKLTEEHIEEGKIKRTKLRHAVQVLSKTVATFIHHHTRVTGHIETPYGPLSMHPLEGKATSEAVLFFNNLFDSVNGCTKQSRATYRVMVSKDSPHVNFWSAAKKTLKNMRFVDPVTKIPNERSSCITNWIHTICGFQNLWLKLQNEGFRNFKPRYINQHSLEKFFGHIRSLGVRNINPTSKQFEANFKTLLINNLSSRNVIGANCKNVDIPRKLLLNLKKLIEDVGADTQVTNVQININGEYTLPNLTAARLITGNQAVKAMYNSQLGQCIICSSNMNIGKMIFLKGTAICEKMLPEHCYKADLCTILKTILLIELNLNVFPCKVHFEVFVNNIIRTIAIFSINSWSCKINKLLKGIDSRGLKSSIERATYLNCRKKINKLNTI